MNGIYNFKNYDAGTGTVSYMENEEPILWGQNVAKKIVEDLHPRTVLDAGCATGHLVAALRDLGVEAYGIVISDYAISMLREDIQPYCTVGSLTEPLPQVLPQKYDLIISIEVLEHLNEEEGKKAIQNLCKHTDQFVFATTPSNFEDPTHINVRPQEYWARIFSEEGFFDNLSYRPLFLTEYASCFCRGNNWTTQQENYERYIVKADADKKSEITKLICDLDDKDRYIQSIISKLSPTKNKLVALKSEVTQLNLINQKYHMVLDILLNSRSWRITAPLRKITSMIRSNKYTFLIAKGIKSLLKNGISATWNKVKRKLKNKFKYKELTRKPLYTKAELKAQTDVVFPKNIKFSILVPLYNTPENFLREMIQSVLDQTYANWELCLADGSDAEHGDVEKICKAYSKKDPRVRYQKLEHNLGISGNTNACIDMATGDYISLFDHDDLLHPAALYEIMIAICEKNADFIYTDENTFRNTPKDAYCPHYKPDYAPDTLRSYNYICHLTTFRKALLDDTGGGFRSEFDGSQDYDLILRLTEKAKHIVHIPKILYYWRCHANSVASDISAKPYTVVSAKKALTEHLARVGLKGEVLDSSIPSTYRIHYEIDGCPLVSILIPNKDHIADLEKCLRSIHEKSTYQNWEIIVIENNSTETETFAFYKDIQKDTRIHVVTWDGEFNYSAINNFGAQYASGEYILLLNNDIEIITADWIEQLLMYAQRKDVGAVGTMLYYPDDTIQHAGVILGLGGVAGHSHKNFPRGHCGYMYRLTLAQNYSCVTAACLLMRKQVWDEVNGLDESFKVAFNDVDLCMRIRKANYLVVWTPYAEMYHHESKSRGSEDTPEKQKRFAGEIQRFQARWANELLTGDPYYNPNFTLDREDFSLK